MMQHAVKAKVAELTPQQHDLIKDFAFLGFGQRDWPLEFVGKFSGKRLVVCAGAKCVWDDLARLGVRSEQSDTHVMAVNDISMHLPMRMRHLYSNDRKMIPHWLGARRKQYERAYGPVEYTHTLRVYGGAKVCWPWPGHGTSLLGAVYSGLAMGYDRIVICGGPLDNSPNYFSPPWEERNFLNEVPQKVDGTMAYWESAAKRCFRNRIRSMSGRTRELLGPP